ncbi:MAG: hypothetical protein R6W78_06235 [Bacteroidales bacterium]
MNANRLYEATQHEIRKKEQYAENINKTTSKKNQIVNAALAGSIETLFLKKHKHLWDEVEKNIGSVIVLKARKPLDNCLLYFTARNTFLKGGMVFLEEPDGLPEPEAEANAILRY